MENIKTDIRHMMADGYPANRLEVDYAVRIDALDMTGTEAGDAGRLARQAHGERLVIAAAAPIAKAVQAHPDQQCCCCVWSPTTTTSRLRPPSSSVIPRVS